MRKWIRTFLACLGLAFIAPLVVLAAPETNSGSPPSIPDLPSSGSSGGSSSSSGSSNYDFPRENYNPLGAGASGLWNSRSYEPRPRSLPIYFPPAVPRLNAHIELPPLNQSRQPAPPELAAYVNEPFYAPLSTRLALKSLKEAQRKRLDRYLQEKIRLQNELHAKLAAVRNLDPAARANALQALAREQEPRLAALDVEAEAIRDQLVRGVAFQANADWNETRTWRLGDTFYSASGAIGAQFQVMRASVFYSKGLGPAQRRLLREVAMELGDVPLAALDNDGADVDPEASKPNDANPLFYFSPETARVRLPADLPPEVADKISKYEREKSDLKRALRETIYERDKMYFGFVRVRALEALSREQNPRIEALELLAEEIRRDLARLPSTAAPSLSEKVPPAFLEGLTAFLQEREKLQKELLTEISAAGRDLNIRQIATKRDAEGRLRLTVSVSAGERESGKLKELQDRLTAFSAANSARNDALVNRLGQILDDAATILGLPNSPQNRKEIDRFVSECVDTAEARSDWERYGDYRTAVLEPGLSPAQRRLLFDAALVSLELPLPHLEARGVVSDFAAVAPINRRPTAPVRAAQSSPAESP